MEITITKVATKMKWYMLNYPVSNISCYELYTEKDEFILNGNITIPQEVIDTWGTDDSTIQHYILEELNKTK